VESYEGIMFIDIGLGEQLNVHRMQMLGVLSVCSGHMWFIKQTIIHSLCLVLYVFVLLLSVH